MPPAQRNEAVLPEAWRLFSRGPWHRPDTGRNKPFLCTEAGAFSLAAHLASPRSYNLAKILAFATFGPGRK